MNVFVKIVFVIINTLYTIGYVGKIVSKSIFTFFES